MEEVKQILKTIDYSKVKKITVQWEKIFSDKAFPKIEIELK